MNDRVRFLLFGVFILWVLLSYAFVVLLGLAFVLGAPMVVLEHQWLAKLILLFPSIIGIVMGTVETLIKGSEVLGL